MKHPQQMPVPQRFLVVAAHPDDAEAGCGGTVAKLVKAGAEGYFLILTNGDKGMNPGTSAFELAATRAQEARNAAARLGVHHVTILNYADGDLQPTPALRGEIVHHIRRIRPDAVFTHEALPYSRFDGEGVNHSDHRACGQATMDAVYPYARGPAMHPEHNLPPHTVRALYVFGSLNPNHYEDVGQTAEDKLAALAEHRSQFGDHMPDWFRNCLRTAGDEAGIEFAESFYRITFNM